MKSYDEIRPYRDDEVAGVLQKLVSNRELQAALARYTLPRLYQFLPGLSCILVHWQLHKHLASMTTVANFQSEMVRYFKRMLKTSTRGLSHSGLEQLDPERGYLFISNHRDIALDSGCLNYALFEMGLPTTRSAIGDNLTEVPYVEDLLRLNKSFKIRRNVRGVKKAYAAISLTSRYIQHSLQEQQSIWIAQREGRSKNGYDRTDPAIIKMLALAWRKQAETFSELLACFDLLPVSLSYEFDPCDVYKARELYALDVDGKYQKTSGQDIRSIVAGITGYNGTIHVHVGEPLKGVYDSADAVARALDHAVVSGLQIYASNRFAVAALASGGYELPRSVADVDWSHLASTAPLLNGAEKHEIEAVFQARLKPLPKHLRPYVLMQYANVVRNRIDLGLGIPTD